MVAVEKKLFFNTLIYKKLNKKNRSFWSLALNYFRQSARCHFAISGPQGVFQPIFGYLREVDLRPALLAPFIGDRVNDRRVVEREKILVFFGKFERGPLGFLVEKQKSYFIQILTFLRDVPLVSVSIP